VSTFLQHAAERRWLHLDEYSRNSLWRWVRSLCPDAWPDADVDTVYSDVLVTLARRWDDLSAGANEAVLHAAMRAVDPNVKGQAARRIIAEATISEDSLRKRDDREYDAGNALSNAVRKVIQFAVIDERRRKERKRDSVEDADGVRMAIEVPYDPTMYQGEVEDIGDDESEWAAAMVSEPELVPAGGNPFAAAVVAGPGDADDGSSVRAVVRAAVAALPERQRVVVEMHDLPDRNGETMTLPQIAEKLGLTERPVWQRLHDGRAALRAALEPWGRITRTVGTFSKATGPAWQGTDGRKGATPEVHAAVGCWQCVGQDVHLLDGVRIGDEKDATRG
jgi:RNA polymerase sigma factor (sigma-70 family)